MAKDHWLKLPDWLRSNVFYRAKLRQDSGEWVDSDHTVVHPFDANLVSSQNIDGTHSLLLDLDGVHWYAKSTTPGHAHLAIYSHLTEEAMTEIIDVLVKYGIIQHGIKRQWEDRKCLTLRMPGMKKNSIDDLDLKDVKGHKN